MAAKGDAGVDMEDLCMKFDEMAKTTGDAKKFQNSASNKLVATYLKDYKKQLTSTETGIVCSRMLKAESERVGKTVKNFPINDDNINTFLQECAHEIVKKKDKGAKLHDPKVDETKVKLMLTINKTPIIKDDPKKKDTAVVSRLTDTKGYTGAHKERFDKSGKGKGIEGREDVAKNTGYVGNYRNEGTYGKGKK